MVWFGLVLFLSCVVLMIAMDLFRISRSFVRSSLFCFLFSDRFVVCTIFFFQQVGALELQQVRAATGGVDPLHDDNNASADRLGLGAVAVADDAAKAKAEAMQKELDKKNMSLAKAEEKCLVLEARQEDFAELLQGFREDKVGSRKCCEVPCSEGKTRFCLQWVYGIFQVHSSLVKVRVVSPPQSGFLKSQTNVYAS